MVRGIRKDLRDRIMQAHDSGTCVFPESPSDAHRLRRAVRRGDLVSPAPRLFALPEVWNELDRDDQERLRIRGLSQLHPSWVFCSFSAALIHGLSVAHQHLDKVHVACARRAAARSRGVIERHVISNVATEIVGGIRVTSLARTLLDAINACTFPHALALADSALRKTQKTNAQLATEIWEARERNARPERAIEVVSLGNSRAESGGESVARARMLAMGFLLPELQVEIPNPVDPRDSFRVDFFWRLPGGDVAGELDGHEKYTNPQMTGGRDLLQVMSDERLRESRLTGANVKVMRFGYKDVWDTRRFRHLLTSYGVPDGYAVPRIATT